MHNHNIIMCIHYFLQVFFLQKKKVYLQDTMYAHHNVMVTREPISFFRE